MVRIRSQSLDEVEEGGERRKINRTPGMVPLFLNSQHLNDGRKMAGRKARAEDKFGCDLNLFIPSVDLRYPIEGRTDRPDGNGFSKGIQGRWISRFKTNIEVSGERKGV